MMTREQFLTDFWNYYLLLEKKFLNAIQYVELTEKNYETYSIEFVNQLQSLGSEVDVVFKKMCELPMSKKSTIMSYAHTIIGKHPTIVEQEVKILGKNMIIAPFEGWNTRCPAQSLFWWKKYNNVKHGRVDHYEDANLKCVLFLLSGLFIFENYWLREIALATMEPDIPDKRSDLLALVDWKTRYIPSDSIFFEGRM